MYSLNRTYTISKENNDIGRNSLERQKWDKQHNALNSGLNSSNFITNDRKLYVSNGIIETPTWAECSSENS